MKKSHQINARETFRAMEKANRLRLRRVENYTNKWNLRGNEMVETNWRSVGNVYSHSKVLSLPVTFSTSAKMKGKSKRPPYSKPILTSTTNLPSMKPNQKLNPSSKYHWNWLLITSLLPYRLVIRQSYLISI